MAAVLGSGAADGRGQHDLHASGRRRPGRGSLSLVSSRPHAFDEEAVGLAAVFAAHATLALVGAEEVRNLTAMVSSRDVIGQAKGILMERLKLTNQEAFATLVRASQNNNIKLRVLCEQLNETGALPR